ncbi:MAG: RNA polymerase sigma factor, partial [Turicibacter sp.]
HYDKIYRYCYFKVKDQTLAEDLTQETFLRYFSQTSYLNQGKQLAYLYTIAKNLCLNEYARYKVLPLNEEVEFIPTELIDLETGITVRQAVQTLPQDLQEIVLLRYSNELNMSEIAAITDISRFAVYRKLKTAIKQLKQLLREEDFS